MRGMEVIQALDKRRNDEHCFVTWWRKENDFLDYDLIDRFVNTMRLSDEIGGFDLLTMDEMWEKVAQLSGTRVTLIHDKDGDRVKWVHKGKTGTHVNECAYTPETVLEIFDVETKGNPVD